jgi:hypothetical protein
MFPFSHRYQIWKELKLVHVVINVQLSIDFKEIPPVFFLTGIFFKHLNFLSFACFQKIGCNGHRRHRHDLQFTKMLSDSLWLITVYWNEYNLSFIISNDNGNYLDDIHILKRLLLIFKSYIHASVSACMYTIRYCSYNLFHQKVHF